MLVRNRSKYFWWHQVRSLLEWNIEEKPLTIELIAGHAAHLARDALLTKRLEVDGVFLQGHGLVGLVVALLDVVQDDSILVGLAHELQERHVTPPGALFVQLHVAVFQIIAWNWYHIWLERATHLELW